MGHPNASSFYAASQASVLVSTAVATIKARKGVLLAQACPPNAFGGTEVSVDVSVQIEVVEPPLKVFTESEMKSLLSTQRLSKHVMSTVLDMTVPSKANPLEMETVYAFPLAGSKLGDAVGRDVNVKTVVTLKSQSIKLDRALNTWVDHGKVVSTNAVAQFLGDHGIGSVLAGKSRHSLDEFLTKHANTVKQKQALVSCNEANPSQVQGRAAGDIQFVCETPAEENIFVDLSETRGLSAITPMKKLKSSLDLSGTGGAGSAVVDEADLSDGVEEAVCDEVQCAGSIGEPLQRMCWACWGPLETPAMNT
jgi:hypothetical protein